MILVRLSNAALALFSAIIGLLTSSTLASAVFGRNELEAMSWWMRLSTVAGCAGIIATGLAAILILVRGHLLHRNRNKLHEERIRQNIDDAKTTWS